MIDLRDVVVEVDSGHTAQVESWLLGHGRRPAPLDTNGSRRRYLVAGASEAEIADMKLVGGYVRKRG